MNANKAVQPSQNELPLVAYYPWGLKLVMMMTGVFACVGTFVLFTGRIPALEYLNPTLLSIMKCYFAASVFIFPYLLWSYTRTVSVDADTIRVSHFNGLMAKSWDRSNLQRVDSKSRFDGGVATVLTFNNGDRIKVDNDMNNRRKLGRYLGHTD